MFIAKIITTIAKAIKKMVFVGDRNTDRGCAERSGVDFIFEKTRV